MSISALHPVSFEVSLHTTHTIELESVIDSDYGKYLRIYFFPDDVGLMASSFSLPTVPVELRFSSTLLC